MIELQQETDLTSVERPMRLAAGAELTSGPRGEPLLYLGHRRVYMRISPLGAEVVRLLTGSPGMTAADLVAAIHEHYPQVRPDHDGRIVEFVEKLIQAGALQMSDRVAEAGPEPSRRILFQPRSRLPLRIRLFRPGQLIAPALGRWFGRRRVILLILAVLLLFTGLSYLVVGPKISWRELSWPLLAGAILLHGSLHECCHALASSAFGIKIRDAGIAVLYWFVPVLYVDRTDSYRLRDSRQRAWIAIAGPMFDASAAGLTALISWSTTGSVAASFGALSLCQLLLLFSNLNPLLPSDGYHAIEAFAGELNVRRRAFLFLLSRAHLRELPSYLRGLSPTKQWIYSVYGLASAAYFAVLAMAALAVGYECTSFISGNFK